MTTRTTDQELPDRRPDRRTRRAHPGEGATVLGGPADFVGIGLSRLDPADEPVAQIGDELAIARALADLSNQLFALTSTDIQASTHEPVTGLRR